MRMKKQIFNSFNNNANKYKVKALNTEGIDFLNKERIRNKDIYTKEEDDMIVYIIELLKTINSKL